jgi:hypothetical protein
MQSIVIYPAYKLGRSRSDRDNIGNLTHALKIPRNDAVALCGAKPSKKSNGWIGDSNKKVTYPKCLEKLNTIGKKIEFIYDNSLDVGF